MAYETLLLSDKATVVLEKIDSGKISGSSSSWADPSHPRRTAIHNIVNGRGQH
jgi:hypothetical protein